MPEKFPRWTLIAWLLVPATTLAAADLRAIPAPRDIPYAPGTLTLHVDATDLDHRLFRVHETIPATAGSLVLFYPKWLPGNHAPTGPIALMQGLVITAGLRPLEWHRDPVDMYAFHVDVPRGVEALARSGANPIRTDEVVDRIRRMAMALQRVREDELQPQE